MRVLVLGAYGLIGEAIVDRLVQEGIEVSGLGRNAARMRRSDIAWVKADLARLDTPAAWAPLIAGMDGVVNAAGALQDGAGDNVRAVHETSIVALIRACESAGVRRFVQISAAGASLESTSAFFRTKAAADTELSASKLDWVILRPGLVISATPYGSTALLRALAAMPFVQPVIFADRPVQTVAVTDVAAVVADALAGRLTAASSLDLVEDRPHRLGEVVVAFRHRMGWPKARILSLPSFAGRPLSALADVLGWLGWRSPLRSTAIQAVAAGITGDPAPYRTLTRKSLAPLEATLARLPRGVQEGWFARLYLLKPVVIGTLALFWTASGAIGLFRFDSAVFVLRARGVPYDLAYWTVLAGSLADLALGLAVLVRPSARLALVGMILVTLFYLGAATLLIPGLWLDPLGALVKTLPALVLILVALAVLDDR